MRKNAKRQVIARRLSKRETVSLNQHLQIIEYQPHLETGCFLSTAEAYFNRVNPGNIDMRLRNLIHHKLIEEGVAYNGGC